MATAGVAAAESGFPFNRDLLLDVRPMKGSKRVPVIEIDESGRAIMFLWCDRVQGQAVISGSSISITPVARANDSCSAAQAQADDEMLDALQQVTNWRRTAGGVVMQGAQTLSFRLPSN